MIVAKQAQDFCHLSKKNLEKQNKKQIITTENDNKKNEGVEATTSTTTKSTTEGHSANCISVPPPPPSKRTTSETTDCCAGSSISKCDNNQKIDQIKQTKGDSQQQQQETRSEKKRKSAISDSGNQRTLKVVEACETRDTSTPKVPLTNNGSATNSANNAPQQPPTALALPTTKFQQRQQKFLAAAAKSSTPSHLKRQQAAAAAAAANGTSTGRAFESAWRSPLLPTLLARVNNSPHFSRAQQQLPSSLSLTSKPQQTVVNQCQQQQQQHQSAAKTNARARPTTTSKERVAAARVTEGASIRSGSGASDSTVAQANRERQHHTLLSSGVSSGKSSSRSEPNVACCCCPSALMTSDTVTTCGDNCIHVEANRRDNNDDCVVSFASNASQDTAVAMKKASTTTECADNNQQRTKTASGGVSGGALGESQKQHNEQVRQAVEKADQARKKPNQNQVEFHSYPLSTTSSSVGHQASYLGSHNNNNNVNHNINNHYQNHYHNQLHKYHSTSTHQPRNIMAHYKFHNDCQSSVLTYEQVKRLDFVMDQTVPIHGRGNTPTLYVKLKELIRLVKYKLQNEHSIEIRDVRLNGGAASYVLAPENSQYNDLDLIFGTDLSNEDRFDVIRDVVLESLMEFYPDGTKQQQQHQQTQHQQYNERPCECTMQNDLPSFDQSSLINDGCATDDDDLMDPSRSNRSSSFESDNLNVTICSGSEVTTDENASDDEAGGIIYADNDDTDAKLDSQADKEQQAKGVDQLTAPIETTRIAQKINVISSISHQQHQMPPNNNCAIKEAYVHKMVKVNDDDRWSLISLGVQQSDANNCMQQQQAHANIGPSMSLYAPNNLEFTDPKSQSFQPMTMEQANYNNGQDFCSGCQKLQQQEGHHSTEQQRTSYPHQQKQSPNSIELKFVDKMRRKFEFSVDSFQIILDSLIQFYDYAPQSTITIQRTQPPSTCIKSSINRERICSCQMKQQPNGCESEDGRFEHSIDYKGETQNYNNLNNYFGSVKHNHDYGSQNCSRSYYQLPIEPTNSASEVSVASSSGCSSSSSVVSSSSSSLSCDDDHEDIYCDADSPPSSSASTSSLLCSTAISLLSSSSTESPCADKIELESQHNIQKSTKSARLNNKSSKNSKLMSAAVAESGTNDTSKVGSVTRCCDGQQQNLTSDKTQANGGHLKQVSDLKAKTTTTTTTYSKTTTASCAVISENFYPTVIGRSEYGNFKEALYHLEKKLIATRSPEEIRGGGLLKYCNLLVKNYKPTNVHQIRTFERYMCSRFFIDFSDLKQQRAKLESYLANHFSDDPVQKFDYLTILHNVVQRSTVCLMNHELRLTLNMIRELAFKLSEQQHAQQVQQNNQLLIQSGSTIVHQKQQQQQQQQQHQQQYQSQQPGTAPQGTHYYKQQDPVVMQSGVYRVKLVNYALAKPVKS